LVLWGENDKLFPKDYAARWGERIPHAAVEIIPQCGHVPLAEQPDPTARGILDLIGRS
jgi:4,5:9,10-diseco-3-hydroxy-5,9,17-trioxoandrosta-1(10),2-diene-4-oate hydrolase